VILVLAIKVDIYLIMVKQNKTKKPSAIVPAVKNENKNSSKLVPEQKKVAEKVRERESKKRTMESKSNVESIEPVSVEDLIREREAARRNKDFARADALREQITALGLELQDTPVLKGAKSTVKNVSEAYDILQAQGKLSTGGDYVADETDEDQDDDDDDDDDNESEGEVEEDEEEEQVEDAGPTERMLAKGVLISDLKIGKGPIVKNGHPTHVAYVGRLASNGHVFDKSPGGKPFTFVLGFGEVIKGWDIGVVGMRRGGKRRIVCPPGAAYGERGSPPAIPRNAALEFEVTVVG